jgi:hypothetical protein
MINLMQRGPTQALKDAQGHALAVAPARRNAGSVTLLGRIRSQVFGEFL